MGIMREDPLLLLQKSPPKNPPLSSPNLCQNRVPFLRRSPSLLSFLCAPYAAAFFRPADRLGRRVRAAHHRIARPLLPRLGPAAAPGHTPARACSADRTRPCLARRASFPASRSQAVAAAARAQASNRPASFSLACRCKRHTKPRASSAAATAVAQQARLLSTPRCISTKPTSSLFLFFNRAHLFDQTAVQQQQCTGALFCPDFCPVFWPVATCSTKYPHDFGLRSFRRPCLFIPIRRDRYPFTDAVSPTSASPISATIQVRHRQPRRVRRRLTAQVYFPASDASTTSATTRRRRHGPKTPASATSSTSATSATSTPHRRPLLFRICFFPDRIAKWCCEIRQVPRMFLGNL
ncbi:uncharacterized protein [Lolium perenne]|uniref:uncharacterized protein n=1 Tax=Lolium perenne TaxID=4522 RepID=UPI0021F51ECE|nr:uncharacterized protein LOC127321553 [Lolium perenne]